MSSSLKVLPLPLSWAVAIHYWPVSSSLPLHLWALDYSAFGAMLLGARSCPKNLLLSVSAWTSAFWWLSSKIPHTERAATEEEGMLKTYAPNTPLFDPLPSCMWSRAQK